MRIAYIVRAFPKISETFIARQIAGIVAFGHEVTIFTTSRGDSLDNEFFEEYQDLLQLRCSLNPPRNAISRISSTLSLLIRHGWKSPLTAARSLNVVRHGKLAATLWLLHASMSIIRNGPQRFDVIHAQFGFLGNVALKLVDIGAIEGELITSFRGYDATKVLSENPGIYSDLFKRGHLFLSVSGAISRRLVNAGCKPNKILVHHSGIDCDSTTYSRKHRLPEEPTHIVTVARLVEKKGIEYSLKAIAKVIRSGRLLTYTIIGDGPLKSSLERLASDLEINAHIKFLGSRSHPEVLGFIAKSHILIAASVTSREGDEEGIPNVLKEAMVQGLPVLGTRHGGIPELIEDSVSGYLVPERDVDMLAGRLAELMDHPERWDAMGLAGKRCIEKAFCSRKLNEELAKIYQDVSHRKTI